MKNTCKCILRDDLSKSLAQTRKDAHLTQAQFSERLMMDTRAYADLERAHNLCCTLTFGRAVQSTAHYAQNNRAENAWQPCEGEHKIN